MGKPVRRSGDAVLAQVVRCRRLLGEAERHLRLAQAAARAMDPSSDTRNSKTSAGRRAA